MKKRKRTEHILVISSYPERGTTHGSATVGVASYTKNTLIGIRDSARISKTPVSITVLAETLGKNGTEAYVEDGIRVKRIWRRNTISSYVHLVRAIAESPASSVLFAFELSMFGNPFVSGFAPLLFLCIRMLGKNVVLVCHQTIDDVRDLSGHIGIPIHSPKIPILNAMLALYYRSMFALCDTIIVFEESFKEKLIRYTNPDKIVVVPHGIERAGRTMTKARARRALGLKKEFVVLVFGFIAWYKGTDWIMYVGRTLRSVRGRRVKIVIAGGPNPNHANVLPYQTYVSRVRNLAAQSRGRVIITGFVPEKEIGRYFQAADVVLFPYRTTMSASGPLSIALAWQKPFLLSTAMRTLSKTKDFARAFAKSGIMEDSVFFTLSESSLKRALRLATEPGIQRRFRALSHTIRTARHFRRIGHMMLRTIQTLDSAQHASQLYTPRRARLYGIPTLSLSLIR